MNAWSQILAAAALERTALALSLRDVGNQQETFLFDLLRKNQDTQFGKQHAFAGVDSIAAFRRRVPLRRDDEFAPWLDATAAGEPNVLTAEPVIAFEATGGGAGGRKIIPYTAASLRAFRAGVLPWLAYLLQRFPRIAEGVAYVAASPVLRAPQTLACGLPLGLPSDAAYLGADLLEPLSRVITVPPASVDLAQWRVTTLAHLAAREDLTLISIWSPSFLLELLDALPVEADAVLAVLHARGDAGAARRLDLALSTPDGLTRHLWPRLQAISLWMDGVSARYAARVGELLPGVHLDGKGVLATESVVTVRNSARACVPALNSAFIEFMDPAGDFHLGHELEAGRRYRVALTTPGGLYRYDLGDELECDAAEDTPALRFVGRAGLISDLVGEKLSDSFVASALAGLDHAASLVPQFAPAPHYELWLDSCGDFPAAPLATRIDELLKANPQYAYARQLGQLREPVAVRAPGFAQFRARRHAAQGLRYGDSKSCALILDRTSLPYVGGLPT